MSERIEGFPFEVEGAWISGLGFTVVFDDALVSRLEGELGELYASLAASEGVIAVLLDDREVFHSGSRDSILSR